MKPSVRIASYLSILTLFVTQGFAEDVDFSKDIQPIFRERCYECHGSETHEAGLRLDARDHALAGGDTGEVIIPGAPDESLLIKLVSGDDPDRVMPPDGDNLTAEEIASLRKWIEAGAEWPVDADNATQKTRHWAYQPLSTAAPPSVKDNSWVANPIDAFVLAKLEQEGVAPSPQANRVTLIRRLYYDLLGLPPTHEAVQQFVDDKSPRAYEHLVDELLQSPHFGERWGRHWLDKARYADSDGYEKDRPRPHAWKYRDWVIQAVNDDMPFDQFTTEQLAGDLLPDATQSQLQATAFNRQTLTNTEGGTDQEEFRVEAIFDRVETLGTVWLGLTVGCARCHSHKYDDISQREYYQLFAFFNNADEQNLSLPSSAEAEAKYQAEKLVHDQRLAELNGELKSAKDAVRPGYEAWEAEQSARLEKLKSSPPVDVPATFADVKSQAGAILTKLEADGSWLVSGTRGEADVYQLTLTPTTPNVELTGLRFDVLPDDSLPAKGPGRADNGNFVLSEITLAVQRSDGSLDIIPFSKATADFAQGGFEPAQLIDGDENTKGWAISPEMGKPHWAKLSLRESLKLQEGESLTVRLVQHYRRDGLSPHAIGRFKVTMTSGVDAESLDLSEEVQKLLAVDKEKRTKEQAAQLFDLFANLAPAVKKANAAVEAHKKKAPFNPVMPIAVLQERKDNRRTTRVLKRGEFLDPLDPVEPKTLHVLFQPEGKPANRMDLAKWLVSKENPLTARVAVNEVWSHLFGQGIVPTLNDFGVRGESPTHPQLLDWLARSYQDIGWSRKGLIRLIVTSNTYKQASTHRPELDVRDPLNQQYARQNRFRVEAEIVRDLYLSASGLLEERIGGPSVFPPLPPGIEELSYANNFKWGQSDWNSRPDRPHEVAPKDDVYRRGMYTFFKRTAAHPNLVTFDCPDSNTTCVKRQTSNTPLQALQTLNNSTFVEASRHLGESISGSEGDEATKVMKLFGACLGRNPNPAELETLSGLYRDAATYYAEHEEEAKAFAGTSDGNTSSELAAWILAARTVLNLDEFLTRE
ncbi:MAG: PSD1 and planctomycete cytochrome C domain-containing protein [Planctomycetaceae bacterium]